MGVTGQFGKNCHLAPRFPVDSPPASGLTLEKDPRSVGSSAGFFSAMLPHDAALRYCSGGCQT
jgi:hypothetical protein